MKQIHFIEPNKPHPNLNHMNISLQCSEFISLSHNFSCLNPGAFYSSKATAS